MRGRGWWPGLGKGLDAQPILCPGALVGGGAWMGRQEEIPLPYGWTEPLWDNFERLEAAWGI